MKKIIIPIGVLLTSSVQAQLTPLPNTENYIQAKTYLDYNGATASKSAETVQYFDGLGRPKQIVNVKASPQGKDVVTYFEYDGFGRQVKDYLPVPQSGTLNGAIVPNPLANATNTPYGSEKIYAEKILENSPLDRIQQQIQVGNDWSNKPVKFEYDVNTATDAIKYTTTTIWENNATKSTIEYGGIYGASQLYKNTLTDEDGNQTIEFKNGKGQTLMVRKVISATENADTYYVYNEYDQLAWVIPPLLSKKVHWGWADQQELAYEYRYDGRNRLVEKKLPGKDWEYMVYDKQDRLVGTQDANLRAKGQWMYTKYDQFSRVIMTGICQAMGNSRLEEQNYANTKGSNSETRSAGISMDYSGMNIYYSVTSGYPQYDKVYNFLSLNYYDTYPVGAPAIPSQIQGSDVLQDNSQNSTVSTKGLPTASYVKNTEANDIGWTKNYTYYDTKGRLIGTHSINHLGGYTKTESKLDFAGAPQNTNTYHMRKPGEAGVTIQERFVYDSQNRVKEHWHQVDGNPEQLLTENTYNELSQLSNKKVGNGLQSIDYDYNIRGWMTDINKNQMPVVDLGGKLFAYKIKYNQREGIENPDAIQFPGKNVKPRYNGNIAEIDWRSVRSIGANPPITPKRYGYAYDGLNRLSAGYYQNPNNPNSKENIESLAYDANGNITSLYRTSVVKAGINTATVIDNLTYTYSGNKLTNIKDSTNNQAGYEGGGGTISYDLNGNMKDMPDKQIVGINYNHLNLPNSIVRGTNFNSTNLYRGDGVKLHKRTVELSDGINGTVTTTTDTDYLDGFQYSLMNIAGGGSPGGGEEPADFAVSPTRKAMEIEAFSNETRKISPTPVSKTVDLQFFPTAEGFYDYEKDQYIYQYKDHLGNVRISFIRNSTGALEITDSNDYYPFGMSHLNTGASFFGPSTYKNYKYNGKELQETGMYDYGARMYMPDIGRWGVVDPRSQYTHEAYSYVWNNPIMFADPTGMQGEQVSDWFTDGKGNYKWDPIVTGPENTPKDWNYVGPTGSYRINGATVQLLEGGKTFTDIDEIAVSGVSPAAAGIVLSQNARFGFFAFLAVASWYVISDFVNTTPTQYGTRIDPMTHSPHTMNAESDAGSESNAETDSTDVNGVNVPDARKGGGKNGQHANLKAKQSAGEKYEEAKSKLDSISRKPNKTKEDNKLKTQLEKQVKHWKAKAQETGENHSRNAKGNR
ncbi:DUF6443 domain-containing protein [Chryseobacterium rhizosphaerae]|uniref:RHS repeat-associated core domain-containing protein n=1 Tax=Chryseobacterium rhizosphaerae TaxID=395937 RepID=A0ABX9IQV8_9FLAO|nr:DUF6443 domain-containing protein [Chryseobacterium rhizosphaerae]REC78750.1 RHS repeat-associated core domain-containing protein [Chryseobacterium rhizosphaerae]GEN67605.1 cell wall-associated protein [Chryseobacterium rhizosphaerae]